MRLLAQETQFYPLAIHFDPRNIDRDQTLIITN